MKEAKINIPFGVTLLADAKTGFSYADHVNGVGCYATTERAARKKLRSQLQEKVNNALAQLHNDRRAMLGCGDGTVLLVEFRFDSWGYTIAGPGLKHYGACGCAYDATFATFDMARDDARRHAEQSYGGIVWETTL